MNTLICHVNRTHGKFSRSSRQHGRNGRFFVICGYCGAELQATENGIFDTNPSKNKAESNKTKSVTTRLSEVDWKRWKESGYPSSLIFRVGLSNVLQ